LGVTIEERRLEIMYHQNYSVLGFIILIVVSGGDSVNTGADELIFLPFGVFLVSSFGVEILFGLRAHEFMFNLRLHVFGFFGFVDFLLFDIIVVYSFFSIVPIVLVLFLGLLPCPCCILIFIVNILHVFDFV
jgi:hypothetical protein